MADDGFGLGLVARRDGGDFGRSSRHIATLRESTADTARYLLDLATLRNVDSDRWPATRVATANTF